VATLQVRDIADGLYSSLKKLAEKEHRSISQEVVGILEARLQQPRRKRQETTDAFLSLCWAWQDKRPARRMIKNIRSKRKNSRRFGRKNVIFD